MRSYATILTLTVLFLRGALQAQDVGIPDQPVIQESPIFRETAAGNKIRVQELLAGNPELASAKTIEPLLLPETDPRNLRVLGKYDTSLTPLHIAGANGNIELAKILLDAGADRFAQTKRYKNTPVELALENNKFAAARLLMNAPLDATDYKIVVNLKEQNLLVLRNGEEILQAKISSGKKSKPSERGEFLIAQKDKNHRSNKYNNAPMPWFCRLSWTAGGIHQGNLPGYPASHGCIRTTRAAAKFIFETCPRGTLVVVQ